MLGDEPVCDSLKTEYSSNARSKCQLCRVKIPKGSWRMQLAVSDPTRPHSDGRPRISWESSHASCYFENVTRPIDLSHSTQSGSYFLHLDKSLWSTEPQIPLPTTEEGDMVSAAMAVVDDAATLSETLPTEALRLCFTAAVSAAIPGSSDLEEQDRSLLDLFCLHKKLSTSCKPLLQICEAVEASRPQPDESGDPLKSKFTQYSPNSQATCRDCQEKLLEGQVRVGAHVFSSSSRHAGLSINYWCVACMCKRPAVRRMARMYPSDLEKVLPGVSSLQEGDLQRACDLLDIPVPTAEALAGLAAGRIRSTRSGRKFNTWGGDDGDDAAAGATDISTDISTGAAAADAAADGSTMDGRRRKSARK